jgi:sugar phosphate isomerase/epimerase
MKFGVCGDPKMAAFAAQAGFEYFEWSVGGLLQPRQPDVDFTQSLAQAQAAGLPCPALNVFIPADLKITGPQADLRKLEEYVRVALKRASLAGVKVIVFGSGGARSVPEGFDHAQANRQIIAFCEMLAPLAQQHGVTIAVEHLNRRECNILTSVAECAALVRQVNHPALRLLVDAYHWGLEQEPVESIRDNGDILVHAHIATTANRLPPGGEAHDFRPFWSALRQSGYDGRLSIEASIKNPERDLPAALAVMGALDAL